jgi:hypothetical protein
MLMPVGSGPTPEIDPRRSRIDIDLRTQAPHILTRGIITPQEAEELFRMYASLLNAPHISSF